MNNRLKNLGRFGFHFTTAIYLLSLPCYAILLYNGNFRPVIDSLLPLEAGLGTSLSVINGSLAVKHAWRALK